MKRLFALCVMVVFAFGCFVGCGEKTESKPKVKAPASGEYTDQSTVSDLSSDANTVTSSEMSSVADKNNTDNYRFKIVDDIGLVAVNENHIATVSYRYHESDFCYSVDIELDRAGTQRFEYVTSVNIGKKLTMYLDGVVIMAPVVNETISDGKVMIYGIGSEQEAVELFEKISSAVHGAGR